MLMLRLLACALVLFVLSLGAPTGEPVGFSIAQDGARCAVPKDVDEFVGMMDTSAGLCAGARSCLRGELQAKLHNQLSTADTAGEACLTAADLGAYMGARTEYCLNKACPELECDRDKALRVARGFIS